MSIERKYSAENRSTKNYALLDLLNEVSEDLKILSELSGLKAPEHVHVEISSRRHNWLGQTHRTRRYGAYVYTVRISENWLRNGDSKSIHDTIMHECCHCMPNCLNHGAQWQRLANMVKPYGFTIERLFHVTEENRKAIESVQPIAKYIVRCKNPNCNWFYPYKRAGKVVQDLLAHSPRCKDYSCPLCHGKAISVEEAR